jgi:hypothetical protein
LVLIVALFLRRCYRKQRALDRDAAAGEIVARADEQHAAILAGDDRGVYGELQTKAARSPVVVLGRCINGDRLPRGVGPWTVKALKRGGATSAEHLYSPLVRT